MTTDQLTLSSLCDRAKVSTRTVRYYIQQGLLPPPERGGPGATYSPGHLDRLQLIRRLKDQHLPLAKIRRRLAGLSDQDIRTMLAGPTLPEATSAADYVQAVLRKTRASPASRQPARRSKAAAPTQTTATTRSTWERHVITEDIELHIRRPLSRDQDRRTRTLLETARNLFSKDSP